MPMVLHCAGWPRWLNFKTLVGSISQRCQHSLYHLRQVGRLAYNPRSSSLHSPSYLGALECGAKEECLYLGLGFSKIFDEVPTVAVRQSKVDERHVYRHLLLLVLLLEHPACLC